MLLPLEHIPDRGLDLSLDPVPGWALAAASEAVEQPVEALHGALHVQRSGPLVEVTGQLEVEFAGLCDRCGDPTRFRLGGEVDLTYAPHDPSAPSERELQADDLDLGFYTHGVLDLATVVQEHLVLLLPPRLVCDAPPSAEPRTCPALSTAPEPDAAGAEPQPSIDPRFAALRNLKLDN